QRHADRMQSEIGAAALIGDGKTVTADPDLAPIDDGKADAARSYDDDAAVARGMCTDAGDCRVVGVDDGAERMRPQQELLERAFASAPRESDGSVHRSQCVGLETGVFSRGTASLLDLGQRTIDADTQRGRAGDAAAKRSSLRVLDARATTRAATVDTDEK